jgi:hypothetical protein
MFESQAQWAQPEESSFRQNCELSIVNHGQDCRHIGRKKI